MTKDKSENIVGTEKEFLDIFRQLCSSRSSWEVWSDLMTVMSCSLSNATDKTGKHYQSREREYERCIKKLGSVDIPAKLFTIVVMAYERDPEQDFLGKLFMNLELGNHWKGQFFTPYSVCRMMAQIAGGKVEKQIEQQGYISVCDPACGAGATLIAAANEMKNMKYNFQNHVLFVGQDIDRVSAMMCYIQLSLLGCAGYICVADTICNPLTGHVLFPEEREAQELWYTPMFFSDVWTTRRMIAKISSICGTVTTQKTVEKEHFYMFFNFEEKEKEHGKENGNSTLHTGSELPTLCG